MEVNGPPANWTINRGAWSVRDGKLLLGPSCDDPPSAGPTVCAGNPPVACPGARVISTSIRLTNSTGGHEGRTGGIVFCSRDPVVTGDEPGYRIIWIDRPEDRGYWFHRNDTGTSDIIGGPTFSQFPLGTNWQVTFDGPKIQFRVDGNLVFDVVDSTYRGGYFGYWAYCNGTALEIDDVDVGDPYATGRIIRIQKGATGAGDGSSWANAYPELSAALDASDEGDELWVAGGTYTPGNARSPTFLLKDGVALYGGFAGGEAKRDLRNPNQHPCSPAAARATPPGPSFRCATRWTRLRSGSS